MSIFGPGRLITGNCEVVIEQYAITQGADGTTIQTFSTVATVPALITQFSNDRDDSYNTDAQRESATLAGVDPSLIKTDTRIRVSDFPDLPELVGTYWRVVSTANHPRGQGGLLYPRVNMRIQRLILPIPL